MAKKTKTFDDAFDDIYKELDKYGIKKIAYSAKFDENGLPINNLNEVAQEGRVVVVAENGTVFGPILNPTWLQLCDMANSAIGEGEVDHVYLEGIKDIDTNKYFTTIKLCMGS